MKITSGLGCLRHFRAWGAAVHLLRTLCQRSAQRQPDRLVWQETVPTATTGAEVALHESGLPDFLEETMLTVFHPKAMWTHVIEADTDLAARIFGLPVPTRRRQTIIVHTEPRN